MPMKASSHCDYLGTIQRKQYFQNAMNTVSIVYCLPDRKHNKNEEVARQQSEEVSRRNVIWETQHYADWLVSVVAII
jgi:hypothetical protein